MSSKSRFSISKKTRDFMSDIRKCDDVRDTLIVCQHWAIINSDEEARRLAEFVTSKINCDEGAVALKDLHQFLFELQQPEEPPPSAEQEILGWHESEESRTVLMNLVAGQVFLLPGARPQVSVYMLISKHGTFAHCQRDVPWTERRNVALTAEVITLDTVPVHRLRPGRKFIISGQSQQGVHHKTSRTADVDLPGAGDQWKDGCICVTPEGREINISPSTLVHPIPEKKEENQK